MKIIVGDRRSGKTTKLIEWLLAGHIKEGYPQWSRVIVTPTHRRVLHTSRMVNETLCKVSADWLCQRSHTHLKETCPATHNHTRAQIAKSVWGPQDFYANLRGQEFDYVVDDYDHSAFSGEYFTAERQPIAIAMTGELVESLVD